MTKQNFPFYFLLQERAKPIPPPYLLPLPPRTNLNPKDFVACGSARTRAFLIKPLVLPSAHTYALESHVRSCPLSHAKANGELF